MPNKKDGFPLLPQSAPGRETIRCNTHTDCQGVYGSTWLWQAALHRVRCQTKVHNLPLNLVWGFSMNYINKKVYLHNDNKKNFSVDPNQSSSESLLKDIRRNTKRIFTSEQKVLIVMEGIRGEQSIAELCRKYGISDSTYYKWNKEFIEAGKARLDGDIVREATSNEVKELRQENIRLKEALADLVVRYDVVKKA